MGEKRALGKGLSSLLPSLGSRSDSSYRAPWECSVNDIIPHPNQPRKLFDKESIDELAASIEEKGILQPLIVRKIGGGKFELIAGERRLRAAKQLHLEEVPVIIKDVESDEVLEIALIENIQREDLNPVEEALAYKELLSRYQHTQDELAKRLGRNRSSIANTLRLLKLPEQIRAYIISGKLSMGHARALLGIENRELQKKLADDIIENDLSVRQVESWIRKLRGEGDKKISSSLVRQAIPDDTERVLYKNIEEDLKKSLKTQVQIQGSSHNGKVVIYFHSKEELDGLIDRLSL